ncbi:hypothetical protein [Cohnella fermenti]|uniref:DNA-binding response regulator n=1 Tax=Cohnella fermenti TaxID=2565925 RepID=A0A4S4C742_9BACL|nr:hypothetical protein [Cohnella fermenti]THF83756.1 hypothetical protein E6C55_03465 [Cohnella fermenti]
MTLERRIEAFIEEQKKHATGQRLEMLNRNQNLNGTRKLLALLWTVLKSFDGLILEYEMVSNTGVRIYIDIFHDPLVIGFEAEGFVAHEEKLTRERFSFERMRIRTLGNRQFTFYPFSWDEMDKTPDACRRDLYELIGSRRLIADSKLVKLPVYEREVLRFAIIRFLPFTMGDTRRCLHLGDDACRAVLRSLIAKGYIRRVGGSESRSYGFEITHEGRELFRSGMN